MRFSSKIDVWLGASIVAVAIIVLKAAYVIVLQPYGVFEAAILVVLAAVVPIWILLSTNYYVINENLWIHSGPFRWKIYTLSISRIESSKSWTSSPALSLDRIRIEYDGGKSIMISPKERTKFLAAIRSSINYSFRYQEIIKKS
ncbi:MAG: hypothetical protein EOO38_06615 [Cytophagaceae bacterium]|nr:MAG: hypothetical protein EOO38_06615 [Cytophagaceae bacterium]